jgi:hypothetical protein
MQVDYFRFPKHERQAYGTYDNKLRQEYRRCQQYRKSPFFDKPDFNKISAVKNALTEQPRPIVKLLQAGKKYLKFLLRK